MSSATIAERLKYRRMWTEIPGYRVTSPGEKLVPRFLELAQPNPSDTLIDLGCGTGRASMALAEAGLNVFQLDITETSRDPHARALPFIEASLWDLPELPKFDWVYCCDVMEHLPTHTVDKALDCMAAITGKGAFMQIALFPEAYGRFIGETLHLTVKPAGWWQEKINQRWHYDASEVKDERLVLLTGEAR